MYSLDEHPTGGEYAYESRTNRLKSVAANMGGESADNRKMSYPENFVYDSEGNLTFDKSKELEISYDWRGMPIEFKQLQQPAGSSDKNFFKLTMSYDGSGRRISKTRWVKNAGSQDWEKELVTHYTGIGTEVREDFTKNQTKVVVNMPEGFGRYGVEDASGPDMGFGAGYIPNTKFEWYLKNHLGSTMLVYGTQANAAGGVLENKLEPLAAYDYRAFGEMVELTPPPTGKVTENFTGKEHDDEIALDYFGARYLDPMLGMWISVDPARQFASPYLYAGNGVNPVNGVDPDGNTTLKLNEDNTVASKDDDGNLNMVSVFKADGSLVGKYNAPPAQSYFSTENIIGQKFDPNMQAKAEDMLNFAYDMWPVDAPGWKTGGELDFKNAYYGKAHFTIGVLKGTIMTAEDAGNAMWGGWTNHMYLAPYLLSRAIANAVALYSNGRLEDPSSSAMQIWGYANFDPNFEP
jgi:RHS repeat-associated protein